MISLEFSAAAAKKQADDGRREQWIYRYLQAGEWANVGLLEGLQSQQRWWIGPLEIELGLLKRCCGPEPDMEYRVPQMAWEEKVAGISNSLMDPLDIPPLIVVYGDGSYIISDGNNRHEAMRRKGWLKCWVLIWHNSSPEFEASQRLLQTLVLGPSQASLGNPMISQAAPNR